MAPRVVDQWTEDGEKEGDTSSELRVVGDGFEGAEGFELEYRLQGQEEWRNVSSDHEALCRRIEQLVKKCKGEP